MIKAANLVKAYGGRKVVDGLTFSCKPGRVTGLIGPNGSGKSTTMKMLLGIIQPTLGHATVLGQPYAELGSAPLTKVGALLDNVAPVPSRRAVDHLRWMALSNGIPQSRVSEVLRTVGIEHAAKKRVGSFSLGMKQRLGLATALLGDPEVLILDEPMNGLDPDGIRWMRELLRTTALEGVTVLVSSHFMNELEEVVDDVVIMRAGELIQAGSLADVRAGHSSLEQAYFSLVEGHHV